MDIFGFINLFSFGTCEQAPTGIREHRLIARAKTSGNLGNKFFSLVSLVFGPGYDGRLSYSNC